MKLNKYCGIRLISVLLCALMLPGFCGCQFAVADPNGIIASADSFDEPLPSPESLGLTEKSLKNHHYHQLTAEEQLLYVAILNSWLNGKDSITLNNIDYYLLEKHIPRVTSAVYADHPECYRYAPDSKIRGTVRYGTNDDTVVITWTTISFENTRSEEERKLDEAISEIVSMASAYDDEYERVKVVHDYLVNAITYDHAAAKSNHEKNVIRNSAYSALVRNYAVCGGYSRAFQLILDRLGIPCTTVSGMSKKEPHAWSLVMLNGEHYLFDLTWDDPEDNLSYKYFAITTAELEKTHTFDNDFTYPTCTATACNYYVKEGFLIETYSMEEADRIITAQNTGAASASMKFTSRAEYDRAIDDIITCHNWGELTAFKDAHKFKYSLDETTWVLTVYFHAES